MVNLGSKLARGTHANMMDRFPAATMHGILVMYFKIKYIHEIVDVNTSSILTVLISVSSI